MPEWLAKVKAALGIGQEPKQPPPQYIANQTALNAARSAEGTPAPVQQAPVNRVQQDKGITKVPNSEYATKSAIVKTPFGPVGKDTAGTRAEEFSRNHPTIKAAVKKLMEATSHENDVSPDPTIHNAPVVNLVRGRKDQEINDYIAENHQKSVPLVARALSIPATTPSVFSATTTAFADKTGQQIKLDARRRRTDAELRKQLESEVDIGDVD